MKPTNEIICKLRAVLELAERGVNGEQTNAAAMLSALMAKHGVTMDDLRPDDGAKSLVLLRCGREERQIAAQFLFRLLNAAKISWREGGSYVAIELTAAQKVEAETHWPTLRAAWKKEKRATLKAAKTAFIHANQLFGPDPEGNSPAKPLTPEEVARIQSLMESMKPVPLHKRLSA